MAVRNYLQHLRVVGIDVIRPIDFKAYLLFRWFKWHGVLLAVDTILVFFVPLVTMTSLYIVTSRKLWHEHQEPTASADNLPSDQGQIYIYAAGAPLTSSVEQVRALVAETLDWCNTAIVKPESPSPFPGVKVRCKFI